ncbi:hypothetical protein PROFUN_00334 [Planoprotostelium fungivorum]|uniref:Phospholipid-transporting ATPase n=1 Tax=Planoprotostelium fungivorum TaxID=1890364 RepID=A0A2P6NY34_9EUKA|nr:hypothetical protein PROFUN_00334 [Planoprotostelium fungivorum]
MLRGTAPPEVELDDMDSYDDNQESQVPDDNSSESEELEGEEVVVQTNHSFGTLEVVPLDDATASKPSYQPLTFRIVFNNSNETGNSRNLQTKFCNNRVSTTKYTWWNFIPKNLYEQFHRLANFFFLVCAILTLIPGITNISAVSSVSPLVFVLAVTACKEAYDDVKRQMGDSEINRTKTLILRGRKWTQVTWAEVQVGDIIKVQGDEALPVDMLLLSTSLSNGMCYIQTANLDGETNLKVRQARPETAQVRTESALTDWNGRLECEQPNKDLYNFDGRLYVPSKKNALSLDNNQLLLRGCLLKNTDFAVGLVVFTGNDTKLRQNARDPPTKRSTLEKQMNTGLLSLFALLFVTCTVCAAFSVSLMDGKYWYLDYHLTTADKAEAFFRNFASYCILFSYMIPISLYVVKLWQTFLLESDVNMYHEASNTPAKAKTSNLIEELGQIDFIFSDKTGTLTSNEMELQKCTIDGKIYTLYEPVTVDGEESQETIKNTFQSATLGDLELEEHAKSTLLSRIPDMENSQEFFKLLAVCHSVLPDTDKDDPTKIVYQASSPDELALVQRAADLGYVFKERTFDTVSIECEGQRLTYTILNMIEFNSNRKRMSVICRCPDGRIRLYCKGADTMMVPRLTPAEQENFKKNIDPHLEYFAAEGLRTLCCASAVIDEKAYEAWNIRFEEANSSLDDRKGKIESAADEIERGMKIVGCTAIEDKLQDGVPEAIAQLRRANINIWVLTGDKQETAINIGLSCKLLTGVSLISLYSDNPDAHINEATVQEELQAAIRSLENKRSAGEEFGLVIEGECLKFCLNKSSPEIQELFLHLALQCKTVVCCRVSPSQKRGVVRAVKKSRPHLRTLAIGDGANDVSMIQEAHIGVGILGKEGMQAAMSSDYAIAQFRYLANMLLVHGRFSYIRTSRLVLYSFYKNAVLSVCLLLFACQSLFSAQNMFNSNSLAGYNVVFAAFPIIFFAILDQDVKPDKVFSYPKLYEIGQKGTQYSMSLLWAWFIYGIVHAFIIYIGLISFFDWGVLSDDGQVLDLWSEAMIGFTAIVIVVNLKVAVETYYWTWINYLALATTIGFWFLYSLVYTVIPSVAGDEYWVTPRVWSTPTFWLYLLIVTAVCILPDVTLKYLHRNYYPETRHIVQEIQREGRSERRKLRKKGFVVKKPTITMMSLNSSAQYAEGNNGPKTHTGYAFAQDDHTAIAFSMSLKSMLKKRRDKKKERKDKRTPKTPRKYPSYEELRLEGTIIRQGRERLWQKAPTAVSETLRWLSHSRASLSISTSIPGRYCRGAMIFVQDDMAIASGSRDLVSHLWSQVIVPLDHTMSTEYLRVQNEVTQLPIFRTQNNNPPPQKHNQWIIQLIRLTPCTRVPNQYKLGPILMAIYNVYEYVNESAIDEDLICCICLEPFVDPVARSCGNTFCRRCIKDLERCPKCREHCTDQRVSLTHSLLPTCYQNYRLSSEVWSEDIPI